VLSLDAVDHLREMLAYRAKRLCRGHGYQPWRSNLGLSSG
jgi:hypothetical protein